MYKIDKVQGYIVQHGEYSQQFIITINGVKWSTVYKNYESLCGTPETQNIVN